MDLDSLLSRAVETGASDVHLKVGQPPVLRRDGTLLPLDGWPAARRRGARRACSRPSLHTTRRGAAAFDETGELDLAYTPAGLPRFRVNGFRQRGSISFAFRADPERRPDLRRRSACPRASPLLAEEHRGLVLCTGATGSGKSTTLAAIVGHINATRHCHIVTIEDPIEILHDDRRASSTSARSGWTPPRSTRRSAGRCGRTRT